MLINQIERDRRRVYLDGFLEGLADAMLETMKNGVETGRLEIEIARRMLANDEPFEKIKRYTSLTDAEILKLRAETAQS